VQQHLEPTSDVEQLLFYVTSAFRAFVQHTAAVLARQGLTHICLTTQPPHNPTNLTSCHTLSTSTFPQYVTGWCAG
jgi:hypothetical protein